MTQATRVLIDELSSIIDKNKFLILSGATGVGKTFLASAIVENCKKSKYNDQGILPSGCEEYETESVMVPIHPSLFYEDFVSGISVNTVAGDVVFKHENKLFISFLKEANESWRNGGKKKFFLILDDIGRGDITCLLGNTISLIEPHGNRTRLITINDGTKVWLSPNVYIVATQSTTVDPIGQHNYAFLRHFYEKNIENDYLFMNENALDSFSDYDINPNSLYYRAKYIVTDNLRHRYQMSLIERDKYIIGHGVFKEKGITMRIRYQVIPLLRRYLKDGILDKTATISIDALTKLVSGNYSKDISFADTSRIKPKKNGITREKFLEEKLTHQPMVNLVTRIKEQGLLDDTDIVQGIMLNPQVLVRKKTKLDKNLYEFPSPGYLYIKREDRDKYVYGTTIDSRGNRKRPRFFYSVHKDDVIVIDGIDYTVASEMQPMEYTRWYDGLDNGLDENERYSTSPNSIMFRILRSYYRALEQHYSSYLDEYPGDDNILKLRAYAAIEYKYLVKETSKLHPEISDEADVNEQANADFRDVISNLNLFWKNRGDAISFEGQNLTVEGVYKVDNSKKYEEYSRAMDLLGIHQMILQGPPGTSKTFSAREYLKYVGKSDTSANLSDEDLDSLQIKDYSQGGILSRWAEINPDSAPRIAWDIVQFHPSYSYEDFVRGIEVSTIKQGDNQRATIAYDTVNKILGEMAEVAGRPEYSNTKFFLVIDEINRANLSTVFGELIYGLEYRGKSVSTPYTVDDSNKVVLPDNLYILGTMNTADKSIGGIDYAIRRRFLFFSLLPDKTVISEYHINDAKTDEEKAKQSAVNKKAVALFEFIEHLFDSDNLNSEYYKDDVQIGHTYFLVTSEDQLFLRFRYQILPILREYFKDGLFNFDNTAETDDGWSGLLDCITGEIDINTEDQKVKSIFEKIIIVE